MEKHELKMTDLQQQMVRPETATESVEPADPAVVVAEPERMNLLGLMVAGMLRRRLVDPAARRHARALRGDVVLEASGMHVTLHFQPSRIEVTRRAPARPRAAVRGTLTALLGAALGRDRMRSFLSGQLRASGSPIALWHVLTLVRA